MSAITDAIAAAKRSIDPIESWIATLDKEDQTAILDAATDSDIKHKDLVEIVNAAGLKIGRTKFTEWRYTRGLPRN